MSWTIDWHDGPFRIPGTDIKLPGSFSPTIPLPDWAPGATNNIDTTVPGTLDRIDLPDVAAPDSLTPTGFQGSDPVRARYAQLAREDYAAMQANLIDGSNGMLRAREYERLPDDADSWPYGQLVVAALDRAIVTGDKEEAIKALKGLDRFMRSDATINAHPDGMTDININRLTDDNAWVGLAEVQAFRLTGDQKYLDGARKIFDYLQSRTQPDGKIYWSDNKDSYNTCSAGPAMQLGLALAAASKESDPQQSAKYSEQSAKWGSFMERMISPETGLVADNVSLDGKVEPRPYTYNQGTLIGAYVQMAEQGDRSKLGDATRLANATLDHFTDERLWSEPPAFTAILFRNLLQLDRVAPNPRIRATLERYVQRMETQARQPNGLYAADGMGAFRKAGIGERDDPERGLRGGGATLIDQSAITQLHALLAMTPEQLAHVT